MKWARLTTVFLRSRLRHPTGWFSLIFAPALVLTMGLAFERTIEIGAYALLPLIMYGALLVPYHLLSLKESGVLHRLLLAPLPPATILSASFAADATASWLGAALTLATGRFALDTQPHGGYLFIFAGSIAAVVAFIALGILLTNLYRSRTIANITGSIMMVALMLTSGVFPLPDKTWLPYSPSWQAATLLQGLWEGQPPQELAIPMYVLAGISTIGGLLGILLLRWSR